MNNFLIKRSALLGKQFTKCGLAALLVIFMFGCTTHRDPSISLKDQSYLAQGERYFQQSYYKKAMRILLPLACDGNPKAEYAVGYMFYYGYGVAQDTEIGHFWIERAANKGYIPAIKALNMIAHNKLRRPVQHQ